MGSFLRHVMPCLVWHVLYFVFYCLVSCPVVNRILCLVFPCVSSCVLCLDLALLHVKSIFPDLLSRRRGKKSRQPENEGACVGSNESLYNDVHDFRDGIWQKSQHNQSARQGHGWSTLKKKRRYDKTRQDKTRQDETRRDKTRQDKTRQDKTRQHTRQTLNQTRQD
jgi:hypothetical protein